jgi:hypothetical protein
MGSTRLSCDHGDLGAAAGVAGAALDLQQALLDLGHFLAKQLDHEPGAERDSMICGTAQRGVHPMIMARTRSPVRRFSFGIISLRLRRPSTRPLST